MECNLTAYGIVVKVGKLEFRSEDGISANSSVLIDGQPLLHPYKLTITADSREALGESFGSGQVRISLELIGPVTLGKKEPEDGFSAVNADQETIEMLQKVTGEDFVPTALREA